MEPVEPNKDQFTLDELKRLYQVFHENNYLVYLNNQDEIEKYLESKKMSTYARLYLKMQKKIEDEEKGSKNE